MSGSGTTYYVNRDGSHHQRVGNWLDNDLRGRVEHIFTTENRTEIEYWTPDGFHIGDRDTNNLPHGKGNMLYHDNEDDIVRYNGHFQHGLKHGFGALTWKNGDLWVQFWIFFLDVVSKNFDFSFDARFDHSWFRNSNNFFVVLSFSGFSVCFPIYFLTERNIFRDHHATF